MAADEIVQAKDRAAILELALLAATRLCHLRKSGFCYVDCKAAILCEAENLHILSYGELPEAFKEAIHVV